MAKPKLEGFRTFSGLVARAVPRTYAEACVKAGDEIHPRPLGADVVLVDVDETWRVMRLGQRWAVGYRIGLQGGIPAIAEIRIYPWEPNQPIPGQWSAETLGHRAQFPAGGVRAGMLRRIRILSVLRGMLSHLQSRKQDADEYFAGASALRRPSLLKDLTAIAHQARRKPRISDRELQRVAHAYRRALNREPARASVIASEILRLPRERVRYLIWLARRRHMLPPTPRGRG